MVEGKRTYNIFERLKPKPFLKPSLYFLVLVFLLASCRKPADQVELVNGYSNKVSYYQFEQCTLHMSTKSDTPDGYVYIKDMNGLVQFKVETPVKEQSPQDDDPSSNGFGYQPSVSFTIPALKSGIYLVNDQIPIVIKSAQTSARIALVYPTNTVNAYNLAGGKNLYTKPKADVVSFERPMEVQKFTRPFLEWLSTLPYDIDYITDFELEDYSLIAKYDVLMFPGHNEYWTREARLNFDKYLENGGNVLMLSGNSMWWQVRYDNDQNRMICFKSNKDTIQNPLLTTINWNLPQLDYPILNSIGADFEHGGYGLKNDNGWDGYVICSNSPLLEGTGLKLGDTLHLPSYETDGTLIDYSKTFSYPVADKAALGFYKIEIVGFDKVFRFKENYATWIVFQKTENSGIVINTATTDWCSDKGIGGENGDKIERITLNMISKLLEKQPVFSK